MVKVFLIIQRSRSPKEHIDNTFQSFYIIINCQNAVCMAEMFLTNKWVPFTTLLYSMFLKSAPPQKIVFIIQRGQANTMHNYYFLLSNLALIFIFPQTIYCLNRQLKSCSKLKAATEVIR